MGKLQKKIMSLFTLFTYILIGDEQDFEFLLQSGVSRVWSGSTFKKSKKFSDINEWKIWFDQSSS